MAGVGGRGPGSVTCPRTECKTQRSLDVFLLFLLISFAFSDACFTEF